MKAKIIVLTLTVVLMLSLSISASAIVADISSDGEFVTINAECGTDYSGKDVFVTVISPTHDVTELPDVSSPDAKAILKQIINYMGKANIGDDGKFSFTYNPGDVSGTYTLRLTGADIEGVYEKDFDFISMRVAYALLEQLSENESNTENGIAFVKQLFSTSDHVDFKADFEILGIDKTVMYSYFKDASYCDDAAKEKIYTELWERRFEITADITGDYAADRTSGAVDTSLKKLADVFNESALYNCFIAIDDGESMGKYIDVFAEDLGISANNVYNKVYRNQDICTGQTKKYALNIVANADYTGVLSADIPEMFANNLILGIYNGTDSYSVMDLMVEAIPDELIEIGVDVAKYDALKYPLEACRKLIDLKPFDTQEEFVEDFNKAISAQKKDEAEADKKPTGGKDSPVKGGRDTSLYIPSQETSYVSTVPESEMNTDVFSDISSVAWAKESIEALAEKGIITGKGNKVFAPNDMVTREEFATMMVRAKGAYDDAASADFADCASGEWYYKYVASAVNSGLMNGFGDDFGVGSNITRQDAAVVIWRALGMDKLEKAENESAVFSDEAEFADYAKAAISQLRDAGIVSGVSEREFSPLTNLTRAQAAKLIYEMLMFTEVAK